MLPYTTENKGCAMRGREARDGFSVKKVKKGLFWRFSGNRVHAMATRPWWSLPGAHHDVMFSIFDLAGRYKSMHIARRSFQKEAYLWQTHKRGCSRTPFISVRAPCIAAKSFEELEEAGASQKDVHSANVKSSDERACMCTLSLH